jgi:hypothetical protein
MTVIPPEAIQAAARACPFTSRDVIRRILEAAEAVWPHDPPAAGQATGTAP